MNLRGGHRTGIPGWAACAIAVCVAMSARWQPLSAQAGGAHGRAAAADTALRGTILGTVLDSAGRPISDAIVNAGAALAATTGPDGAFALRDVPRGAVILRVRRIGYVPSTSEWGLDAAELTLQVRLDPFPTVLPEVRVVARRQPFDARLAGFYARVKGGEGYYLTQKQLAEIPSAQLSDALRRIPGVVFHTLPGTMGNTGFTFAGSDCEPLVMVDGFPATAGAFDLGTIDLVNVEGIEAYPAFADIPAALNGPWQAERCGLLAIWSKPMRPTIHANQLAPEKPANLDSLLKAKAVFTAGTVDEPVRYVTGTASPAYPDSLYRAGVSGHVVARFVVDTDGTVEPATVHIVSATLPAFADAVRQALKEARFTPAVVGTSHVQQLVEMPFDFQPRAADSYVRKP